MSLPTAPQTRAMSVQVNPANVGFRFYSHMDGGRYYQAAISRDQLADIIAHIAEADAGGPQEFLLGFTERTLAFHKIAAVPCPC